MKHPQGTTDFTAVLTSRQATGIATATLVGYATVFLIVLVGGHFGPLGIDSSWNTVMQSTQMPVLTGIALALNIVGGTVISGLLIPVLLSVVLLVRHRYMSALFLMTASLVCAGVVQAVKALVARPRPVDMMITSDSGSFPSGHSANAMVIILVVVLVVANTRWIRYAGVAYVLLMMWSRTYLHAHWVTDTIGGVLLGATVTLLIWVAFSQRVSTELGNHRDRDPSLPYNSDPTKD